MLPSEALAKMDKDIIRIFDEVSQGLLSELQTITPVDTGQLRGAWLLTEKTPYIRRISNNMEYADVILHERRIVAGRLYGSLQFPKGIDPTLEKWNGILQDKLDKLKY